jgi:hypothetical protein
MPYAVHGTTTEDMLALDREAVNVVVRPIETVVRFDVEKTPVVYLSRDAKGQLKRLKESPMELGLVDSHLAEETADSLKKHQEIYATRDSNAKAFDSVLQCDVEESQLSSAMDEDSESNGPIYDLEEEQLSSSIDEEQLSRDLDEKIVPSDCSAFSGGGVKIPQPQGRPRKGHSWNADIGIWVPDNGSLLTQFFSRIP